MSIIDIRETQHLNRLVVVSNRVGDLRNPTQAGGLAVAVGEAITKRGGIWFGWDGETDDSTVGETLVDENGNVQTMLLGISNADYEAFYLGFANSTLWPLFHYRADLVRYEPDFYDGYMRVNQQFADALSVNLVDDDLIWVQDYHFLSLATCLRKRRPDARIGFFLHIPFPPPELLSALPHYAQFIEDLLRYDVLGFQTHLDAANFRRCVQEFTEGQVGEEGPATFEGRECIIGRFPIGIDVEAFHDMASSAVQTDFIAKIRRNLVADKQIIGVDRLDYSKGIPARFEAFSKLLERYPDMSKQVSFLQIAPPTREDIGAYSDIRSELEGMSGQINGTFADFDWTPIRYIHRSVSRDRLAGLLRDSEVGLVTPMRDGMNLVAKEYVAAQNPEDPGVLVLSRFAGAAEEMLDAILVNPFDTDEMADALHQALTMSLKERKQRHQSLLANIREHDVKRWQDSVLDVLSGQVSGRVPT